MVRFAIVSLAYFVESRGRPFQYYYTLLNDFARKSAHDVVVFTNRPDFFDRRSNLTAMPADLDQMVARVWNEPDWRLAYRNLLRRNGRLDGSWEAGCRELIGIWLSKIIAVRAALERYDYSVWLDAGLLYSLTSGHTFNPELGYSKKRLDVFHETLIRWANERRDAVLMQLPLPGPRLHGVDLTLMRDLTRNGRSSRQRIHAGAFVLSRGAAESFVERWSQIWESLVARRQSGTEENVLTIMNWEHPRPTLSREEWLGLLMER